MVMWSYYQADCEDFLVGLGGFPAIIPEALRFSTPIPSFFPAASAAAKLSLPLSSLATPTNDVSDLVPRLSLILNQLSPHTSFSTHLHNPTSHTPYPNTPILHTFMKSAGER